MMVARRFLVALMLVMLVASACSGQQGPAPAASGSVDGPASATAAASPWPDRLPPGGSFSDGSGAVSFVDDLGWLVVGSDLFRVDENGEPGLKTHLVRVDLASGKFTGRVRLRGHPNVDGGAQTFVMGDSIVVRTEAGADVISTKTLRRERELAGGSAFAFGSVWDIRDATADHQVLIRIDPTSGKITGKRSVAGGGGHDAPGSSFAVGAGAVWVGMPNQTVVRLDPKTLRTVATIKLDGSARGGATYLKPDVIMGVGYGAVWANQAFNGPGKLYRIDPDTNRITNSTSLGDSTAGPVGTSTNLAFGNNSVWTCDSSNKLSQVDAATGDLQSVRDQPLELCNRISVGGGSIWLSTDVRSGQPITVRIEL